MDDLQGTNHVRGPLQVLRGPSQPVGLLPPTYPPTHLPTHPLPPSPTPLTPRYVFLLSFSNHPTTHPPTYLPIVTHPPTHPGTSTSS